ncbi:MAG TPA: O-acetyl-ADP-ribose deacetylase [Phycisphaerae bacterium]|nr:O-acetyl-ADP-ribose deacetylase [Phycisphaerae bacterium]HRW53210.1 O-acetyl-ADP-ribose deacetylase [Phycisphaerae bacterium]
MSTRNPWNHIRIIEGDLTRLDTDAIVNAANSSLLGGGGVDGAIHRAAGPGLLDECRSIGGCPTGESRITGGYDLKARYVIHTVGPVYQDGRQGEPEALRACYVSSLRLATDNAVRSIAFPAISCGIYGYPMTDAARIALETTVAFLADHEAIDEVVFVLFGTDALRVYQRIRDALAS